MEEKKKKRIRYPKAKKQEQDKEIENMAKEQPTHFVLDVHNSVVSNLSKIGK